MSAFEALQTAQRARDTADVDARGAAEKLTEAERAFDEEATSKRQTAVLGAQVELERTARILKRAEVALESAIVAAETERRTEQIAQLAALEASLAQWQIALDAAATKLVDVDALVDGIVFDVARATAIAADTHERAELLARSLGRGVSFSMANPRATLAEARLRIQRMVTAARLEEDRDALAPVWLAQANVDDAGWNAAQITEIRAAREAQERSVAAQHAGQVQAALQAKEATS